MKAGKEVFLPLAPGMCYGPDNALVSPVEVDGFCRNLRADIARPVCRLGNTQCVYSSDPEIPRSSLRQYPTLAGDIVIDKETERFNIVHSPLLVPCHSPVPLTAREGTVFSVIAADPGVFVDMQTIKEICYKAPLPVNQVIARIVGEIRKKFGDTSSEQRIIQSRYARGYRLAVPQ